MTPTHLVLEPGAARAACGSKDSPRVWVEVAQMHVDGWSMPVCEACQVATGGVRWPTRAEVDGQLDMFGGEA